MGQKPKEKKSRFWKYFTLTRGFGCLFLKVNWKSWLRMHWPQTVQKNTREYFFSSSRKTPMKFRKIRARVAFMRDFFSFNFDLFLSLQFFVSLWHKIREKKVIETISPRGTLLKAHVFAARFEQFFLNLQWMRGIRGGENPWGLWRMVCETKQCGCPNQPLKTPPLGFHRGRRTMSLEKLGKNAVDLSAAVAVLGFHACMDESLCVTESVWPSLSNMTHYWWLDELFLWKSCEKVVSTNASFWANFLLCFAVILFFLPIFFTFCWILSIFCEFFAGYGPEVLLRKPKKAFPPPAERVFLRNLLVFSVFTYVCPLQFFVSLWDKNVTTFRKCAPTYPHTPHTTRTPHARHTHTRHNYSNLCRQVATKRRSEKCSENVFFFSLFFPFLWPQTLSDSTQKPLIWVCSSKTFDFVLFCNSCVFSSIAVFLWQNPRKNGLGKLAFFSPRGVLSVP